MSAGARLAIVRAAEELFASEGIEGPSLREIARRAGQGNTNAAQYHFGDRDGLLLAVLDRHRDRVESRRGELLDLVEGSDPVEPRALSTALVAPLVAELSEPDGGAAHLQIVAEVLARPVRFADTLEAHWRAPSIGRWSQLVEPLLPVEAVGRPLHRRFAVVRFVHGELASRARERGGRGDHRLFASHLVDLVTAMLAAPVTQWTTDLIRPSTNGGRTR
ncbi:MAG TPA: helix-turn-helix domain-containing protein [Acidimicrobiales bacterium]|nr:helix-turn-helix domain-containing protein [Acidimicrobiales bacterium]